MQIEVLNHASIKITSDKIYYFDPYKIDKKMSDADYIFITHDHYDHFDYSSIKNVINQRKWKESKTKRKSLIFVVLLECNNKSS